MKRIWTMFASAFIILACLCLMDVSAQAAEITASGDCGANIQWELDAEGTLTLSGNGPMAIGNGSAPWGDYESDIINVVIQDGITSIDSYAFSWCTSLKSVSIPEGVTTIGEQAFFYCSELASITLPESLTTIGEDAFGNCESLTSVTVPEGVTSIGRLAFRYCNSLTSITLPKRVTSMGRSVFDGCNSLVSVTIPEGVTSVSNYMFGNCESLTSVTIPSSVTSIDSYAFYQCTSLKSITLPDCVTTIEEEAFYRCTGLVTIILPDSLHTIGDGVFWGCTSLTDIKIPDRVGYIGENAFADCHSLTSIKLPYRLTSLKYSVFGGCSGLVSVSIPEGLTSIEEYAFHLCGALTEISFPDTLETIGEDAFSSCGSLTSIMIPKNVSSIGAGAFSYCNRLTSIQVDADNLYYSSDKGALYDANKEILYAVPGGQRGVYIIPEGVVRINKNAFEGCSGLTGVIIPESVTEIGNYAFSNCTGLRSITIPESMTTLNDFTFNKCISMTNVWLPKSVTNIKSAAFYDCDGLQVVYYGGTPEDKKNIRFNWSNDYLKQAVWYYREGAVTIPTLSLKAPSLSFEDEISYNVYFTVDDASSIAEMGLVTFSERLTDGTVFDAVDMVTGYWSSGDKYVAHTHGIPAKNLSDVVYFKVYAKLTDGSYVYSDVAGYHAVAYANDILNGNYNDDIKALVVSMLNYGAAAQVQFNYKTDSLMNAGISAENQALVAAYDKNMVDDVVNADSSKAGIFVHNGGYTAINPSVSFEGAFSINFYLSTKYYPDEIPVLYYWDAETYATADELTIENASGKMLTYLYNGYWIGTVSGIAAKDIDKTWYAGAVYTYGHDSYADTTYTSPILAYSLGSYCETMASSGNELGAATAVYGYYAKAYFNK